jgi:multicomponent Na+:H+ antiporter subunit F
MDLAAGVSLVILAAVLVLAAIRLVRGPHLADRVIALDLIAVMAIAVMACLAAVTRRPLFLDASLVIALVAFISTVAFARYMERQQ